MGRDEDLHSSVLPIGRSLGFIGLPDSLEVLMIWWILGIVALFCFLFLSVLAYVSEPTDAD